jgi:hypothetical protein
LERIYDDMPDIMVELAERFADVQRRNSVGAANLEGDMRSQVLNDTLEERTFEEVKMYRKVGKIWMSKG